MRERLTEWLCSVAWRVLWRWWPDRHYVWGAGDGWLRETVRLEDARWAAAHGRRVRERLDHAGRPVPPMEVSR